jgi:hypothetical protein
MCYHLLLSAKTNENQPKASHNHTCRNQPKPTETS